MRALLSVYDKSGIVPFARGLVALGAEIVSTGGTLAALRESGVPATAVAEVTGFPEILGGRVKTLHPHIHGGILARPEEPTHAADLAAHAIAPFDVVAVNLYPFEATVAVPEVAEAEAVEQIDIGGPAMLRAAAKNFANVVPICDPADYDPVLDMLAMGGPDHAERRRLAARAFGHTAAYDAAVAAWLTDDAAGWPAEWTFAGRRRMVLRYGENPHQPAAAYHRVVPGSAPAGVLAADQLAGKELSYNNLLDADAAWAAVAPFAGPAVAIIKHTIPCGLAMADDLTAAYTWALAGDPVSAFGGVVALNRPLDGATAKAMAERFFEVIVAPGFDEAALETLGQKKALRLLRLPAAPIAGPRPPEVRSILGGLLVQDADDRPADPAAWTTVSRRSPTTKERDDLLFAWQVVRAVKSNGIVLVRERAVVGVGSGQPNRVESVRIAVRAAGERAVGAVLASDAFFPFADGVEEAARGGVAAIVQPGGSMRDAEVIAAANAAALAMLFTGVRHFRH